MKQFVGLGGCGVADAKGFTLLEVLVALIIVSLGLLGIAALQGRALNAETEAYQRAQATALLNDMVDRINANRAVAPCFVQSYGTGVVSVTACSGVPGVDAVTMTNANDTISGWDLLLKGNVEKSSASVSVGGMLNARGCVIREGTDNLYYVAVAWQGLSETSVPSPPTSSTTALTSAVACGTGQYGSSDAARRVIWTSVRVATLI